jgi:CTP synthase (UTP-ammonia lyase)
MGAPIRIALVGDRDERITAHRAIPVALDLASGAAQRALDFEWLGTERIESAAALDGFDAVWCVPGSPYRNMNGALTAIRAARETGRPFLGTCGGFQHALIEAARSLLGWADADHAETATQGRLVVAPLECALVEASETLRAVPGSRLRAAYGAAEFAESYRCRFGLNPDFQQALIGAGGGDGPFAVAATGPDGSVRALELRGHPFFVATLFQPERAALAGRLPPLVQAFVAAAISSRAGDR